MKESRIQIVVLVTMAIACANSSIAQVYNGDFSLGLNGWTLYLPPGSNPLGPDYQVASIDIDGSGPLSVSEAFHVNVGSDALLDLQQGVFLTAGTTYNFFANLAMTPPSDNADGGTISVFVGPTGIASYSFGSTTVGVTEYATISGTYQPAFTGAQTLSINFSRGYGIGNGWQTPSDWIDNIELTPIPEPRTSVMEIAGLCALAFVGSRKYSKSISPPAA